MTAPGTLQRLHLLLSGIERASGAVSNLAQFAIMAIVVADVIGRYLLNAPIEWVYDLISLYLMAALFFFSLSWTLGTGEHVRVLYFRQFVSWRVRRVFDCVGALLSGALFAVILSTSLTRFWADWTSGDVFVGAYLWPNWIASICVPLGVAIMLLRFALLAATNGMAALTGVAPVDGMDDELF